MPRYYLTKLTGDFASMLELKRYKEERLDKIALQRHETSAKDFSDFCRNHKGLTFDEVVKLYYEHLQRCHDSRDALVLKHCKSQKL